MICDKCGKDKEDVQEMEDPYAKEIQEEIILRNLCEDCASDLRDEI